jgi:hypothetical protein
MSLASHPRSEFRHGTSMLFANPTAPIGWITAADDDTMVRIVSSSGGATGGTNGMANAIGGAAAVSVDNYTLLEADMPSHTHTGPSHTHGAGSYVVNGDAGTGAGATVTIDAAGSVATDPVTGTSAAGGTQATGAKGGGGAHAHTLSLDVKYVDFIRAIKA